MRVISSFASVNMLDRPKSSPWCCLSPCTPSKYRRSLLASTATLDCCCLYTCRWYTISSIVPAARRRYTSTSRLCPMRYALSCACASFAGFQLGSKMTTRFADVMFNPTPPAPVDKRKTNRDSLALKSSTSFCLSFPAVLPSSRAYTYPRWVRNFSSTVSSRALVENNNTLSRCRCHNERSFSRARSLPQLVASPRRAKSISGWSAPPRRCASSPSAARATTRALSNFSLASSFPYSSSGSGFSNSRWLLTLMSVCINGKVMQYGHRYPLRVTCFS